MRLSPHKNSILNIAIFLSLLLTSLAETPTPTITATV
jgi:hypothetical protein